MMFASKLSKSQMMRIVLGLGILLIVLVIYVPRLIYTYSTNAVVTSRAIMVNSPIAGMVIDGPPMTGTLLEEGSNIIAIENKKYDQAKLDELLINEKTYEEKIRALQEEQIEMNLMKEDLQSTTKKYMESLKGRVSLDLDRARLKEKEAQATFDETKSEFASKSELGKKGYVAKVVVDRAKFAHERAVEVLAQVQKEVKRLETAVEDIKKGVFINPDGHTTEGYHAQKYDEIRLRESDLESRLTEVVSRYESTKAAREAEQKRIAQITKTSVKMPIKGTILRTFTNANTHIDVNSPLVEIADCSNLYMHVTLPESYYNKVSVGQKVSIRLNGDSHKISGEVVSMRGGSIDPKTAELLVGDPGVRRTMEMEVIVKIDADQLSTVNGNFCHLGRNGEVIFNGL